MNGWFLSLIIVCVLSLGGHMAKHGEPKNDKYNFWLSLIANGIEIFVVYQAIKMGF